MPPDFQGIRRLAGPSPISGTRQVMPDQQLARALGKSANPILIVDRAGSVIWCNAAYGEMTKLPIDFIMRKRPRALTPTNRETALFLTDVWSIVMGGQIWRGELVEIRPDGVAIHVDAVMTPLDDANGRPAMFMLFLNDLKPEESISICFALYRS